MKSDLIERLRCWVRLGHRWRSITDDERICARCGLRQYVALEDENGGKSWAVDRSCEARTTLEASERGGGE